MRFLFLDVQALDAKERHVILPLMIATFIMESVTFILCHHKFVQRPFSLTIKDQTYFGAFFALCTDDNFLEGSYSIHR